MTIREAVDLLMRAQAVARKADDALNAVAALKRNVEADYEAIVKQWTAAQDNVDGAKELVRAAVKLHI